ncbi:MAG TPA: M20 family metallo-hydrolase [Stellaceae bacterium]|nr:M20 family metallo-hydrolase [Stellaceae bacterium]
MLRNTKRPADAIDEQRLWRRQMELARFGARPDGGVNRQALSAEDIAARRQLIQWATARGFACMVDPIGNLFVRRAGRNPDAAPILTGSHLDSQPAGGKFDGAYGVMAGLEALEALEDLGLSTERPIELVAWCNEEGGRFPPGAMGSAAYGGAQKLDDLLAIRDWEGVTVEAALKTTLAATPEAAPRPLGGRPAAYVEAHIEQGPLLETARTTIGVVTGIQGAQWYHVEVTGAEAHAGTAPLKTRRDALKAAMAMIAALEQLMADETDTVRFTVGRFDVTPNSTNTVPGRVLFTIDFRHPDAGVLARLGGAIEGVCRSNARGCEVHVTKTLDMSPIRFDPAIQRQIDATAGELGLSRMAIASGAFHDAKYMNPLCPSGMIFVPCEKGISHNPVENATPGDLAAGAKVLVEVLLQLAEH